MGIRHGNFRPERIVHTEYVPGGAQGVRPESNQNACHNGTLRKLPPGLADQQQWFGISSEAKVWGANGTGVGIKERAQSR
eukprot:1158188-Pelagomonas_calceolata.AAC.12